MIVLFDTFRFIFGTRWFARDTDREGKTLAKGTAEDHLWYVG